MVQDETVHAPAMVHRYHGCSSLDHTADHCGAVVQTKTQQKESKVSRKR